ncbi:MAG: universal stress protein, partial [Myxococcaceae bacterium]
LATDFSNPAQPALEAAADYARRAGTRVTALHCLEYEPPHPPGAMPSQALAMVLSKTELATLRDSARDRLVDTLGQYGIEGSPVVSRGRAAESIVELARTLPAELVCVGTSGFTGLRRILLGSVAEEVVRTAPCSVLVVRRETHHRAP